MTLWREQHHVVGTHVVGTAGRGSGPTPSHPTSRPTPPQPVTSYSAVVYLGSGEPGSIRYAAVDYLRRETAVPAAAIEDWDLPEGVDGELEEALRGGRSPASHAPGGRTILLFCANRASDLLRLLSEAESEGLALPEVVPVGTDVRREGIVWELGQLLDLTALLRLECPWDRKQTQESIVRYTLEETYELVDAVERLTRLRAEGADTEEAEREVRGELGDLLFQVYFLASVAEEAGGYDVGEVAAGIHRKLVRRHPHIFGETVVNTAEDVKRNWDQIKRSTEGREGIFHEVPSAFPALLLAQKLQARAAEVGFDWPDAEGPLEKVREEQRELEDELELRTRGMAAEGSMPATRVAEEMGDVLFALVNLARKLRVDPELALRSASQRFRDRVSGADSLAAEDGLEFAELGLDEQEEYYQRAKRSAGD